MINNASILAAYILPHPPVIVPEVGRGQEKKVQSTVDAYEKIAREIGDLSPETIVVISPHSVMYADYIHISPYEKAEGDLSQFGVAEVGLKVNYDAQLASEIAKEAEETGINAGTLGQKEKTLDHGTLVPLYFVNKYCKDYKVVRISISGLSFAEHYQFGVCLQSAIEKLGRKTVIIASGDLSHKLKDQGPYEYAEEGTQFDQQVTAAMKSGNFLDFLTFSEDFAENAGECGLRSFIIMAGGVDRRDVTTNFLSYEGTFGVGYAVCGFKIGDVNKDRNFGEQFQQYKQQNLQERRANEDEYVKLARLSLETFIKERREIKCASTLPKKMTDQKAGVFVSLKKDGRLRGCIGTISATQPDIAAEIIKNAVSAGIGDPRFDPVTIDELSQLVYSVDVLGEAESIESIDQLDVKKYGVIVSKGHKRGLLLPNLDGITKPSQQVEIALQKGGILPTDSYSMERFEVIRHC